MTARILDGRKIARDVLDDARQRTDRLKRVGLEPQLSFITIGESTPAQMYAQRLGKLAASAGIKMTHHALAENSSVHDLEEATSALSGDDRVDGILVQMPLPDHLSSARISTLVDPRKDVDGMTIHNSGRLYLGLPGQTASTATGMIQILDSSEIEITGKHAVVVGRSKVVGHPVAELLLKRSATITITHTKTKDLAAITRQADILMVGAGRPGLITGDMVRPGAVIVDAGTNPSEGGLVGDVDFESAKEVASAITPVPGGVGPVTNAVLLRHVVASAEQR